MCNERSHCWSCFLSFSRGWSLDKWLRSVGNWLSESVGDSGCLFLLSAYHSGITIRWGQAERSAEAFCGARNSKKKKRIVLCLWPRAGPSLGDKLLSTRGLCGGLCCHLITTRLVVKKSAEVFFFPDTRCHLCGGDTMTTLQRSQLRRTNMPLYCHLGMVRYRGT